MIEEPEQSVELVSGKLVTAFSFWIYINLIIKNFYEVKI